MRARQAELDKRLAQLDADIAREQQMVRDNADILQRLADEEATLDGRECGGRRAATTATRAAFDRGRGDAGRQRSRACHADRRARRGGRRAQPDRARAARDGASAATGWRASSPTSSARPTRSPAASPGLPIPPEKRALAEEAQPRLDGRRGRLRIAAEKAVAEARAGRSGAARPPLQEAQGRAGAHRDRGAHAGQDPQCRRPATCSRRCWSRSRSSAATRRRLAPPSARISTCRSTAARRRIGRDSEPQPGDPALPRRRRAAWPSVVRAPPQLARRLAQIGIVDAADGARLQTCWRPASGWSAATARCGAGTGWSRAPMRRPPPRSAWRRRTGSPNSTPKRSPRPPKVRAAEQALADAERALREGTEAERAARQGWRDAQHAARRGARRAAAGGKGGRRARRPPRRACRSRCRALDEAHAEACGRCRRGRARLDAAPDLAELQAAFDTLAADVQRDRATLADARARHDGLKREAEQRARRLAAIAAERSSWMQRAENADRQIAALDERRDEARAEHAALADAPDEIDAAAPRADVAAVGSRKRCARRRPTGCRRPRTSRPSATRRRPRRSRRCRKRARARARAEERLTAADERRREVEARIQEALNTPPHLVIRHTGLEPDDAAARHRPTSSAGSSG